MFLLPDLKRLRRKWRRLSIAEAGASVAGSDAAALEHLAPEPDTTPPPPSLLGYVSERSTRHVAGWVHNPADPAEHPEFEVVCTLPGAERVLARSRAEQFSPVLEVLALGDGTYGFRVLFGQPVSEAERDHLEVRPIATGAVLPHDPNMRTRWEPIRFVAMDIVNNCNLRCPFCVYDYSEVHTTKLMTDEVYDAALKLLPLVGPDCFWLSCLHEPTMHPKFAEYIERIPAEYRNKVFFTSNFARRMPDSYYDTLAGSGLRHINISIELRDPAIYERMRKGARHHIFMESWDKLLAAFSNGGAPPLLRYIIMAYKSNLREIPELVEYLRTERLGHNVEVRHTFDEAHIPADFRASEYLDGDDWRWLKAELEGNPRPEVVFWPPPGLAAAGTAAPAPPEPATASAPDPKLERIPGLFQVQLFHDGFMAVAPSLAGASPKGREQFLHTNVTKIGDPVDFVMSLSL